MTQIYRLLYKTYIITQIVRAVNSDKGSASELNSTLLLLSCSEVAYGTFSGNQGNWHRVGRSELSHHRVKIDSGRTTDVYNKEIERHMFYPTESQITRTYQGCLNCNMKLSEVRIHCEEL